MSLINNYAFKKYIIIVYYIYFKENTRVENEIC